MSASEIASEFNLKVVNPENKAHILEISANFSGTGTIFKDFYRRNVLKTVSLGGEITMVKSFKVPGTFKRLIYGTFRKSKARRSFENSIELKKRGIHVPEPMAFTERIVGGQLYESFYFSKFESDTFTLHDVLLEKVHVDQKELLHSFTVYVYELHQKGVYHLDLTPGNVLVSGTSGAYRFSLVDVNRMRFFSKPIAPEKAVANLGRLTNLPHVISDILDTYASVSKKPRAVLWHRLENAMRCYQGYRKFKSQVKGYFKHKKLQTVTSLTNTMLFGYVMDFALVF